MAEELTRALVDLREADALALVDRMLAGGVDPVSIIDACRRGMEIIGERFASGEAFIPELVMAGEIMQAVSAGLKPHLEEVASGEKLGTIVMGTVKGDIHDIGKDIVITLLDTAGFDVVDLGTDVSPQRFVDTARERGATIVGLSCLLTQAIGAMKDTVSAVNAAGLGEEVSVMIGGAPITSSVCEYTGADGWGKDAVAAVELARQWAGGR